MKKIQNSAFLLILLIGVSLISCKQEEMIQPGFGTVRVNASAATPSVPVSFVIKIDGKPVDTLDGRESYQKSFNVETGSRHVSIIDQENGKELYNDNITVDLQKDITLPAMMIRDQTLLVDDYDPAVIKPAPGNMLARFIVSDPALPEVTSIKFSVRYTSNATGAITFIETDKEVKNIFKDKFSEYIELVDPTTFDPDGYSHTYVFEGWNAATGEKVMDFTARTYGFMRYGLGNLATYEPNNVITMEIPASATGTTHIGKVIFQKTL